MPCYGLLERYMKGLLFWSKVIKGYGIGPRGGASPHKTLLGTPPPPNPSAKCPILAKLHTQISHGQVVEVRVRTRVALKCFSKYSVSIIFKFPGFFVYRKGCFHFSYLSVSHNTARARTAADIVHIFNNYSPKAK